MNPQQTPNDHTDFIGFLPSVVTMNLHFTQNPKFGSFRDRVLQIETAKMVQIRLLHESDPPSITAAFTKMGWNKPETLYRRYLDERMVGTPNVPCRYCRRAGRRIRDGELAVRLPRVCRPEHS
jgi:hypothetical protein